MKRRRRGFGNGDVHAGFGGAYTSLALAQAQLASYAVDNPTPQQIAAALNGGAVTSGTGESVALAGGGAAASGRDDRCAPAQTCARLSCGRALPKTSRSLY